MNRVVHFEVHAKDVAKMDAFYTAVFGWKITDMGETMGNYCLVVTGEDKEGENWRGINGGLTSRKGELPSSGSPVNAFVCTMSVENIDATLSNILAQGGSMALEKMEVPGVGLLAYCKDPEGNIFGVLQPAPMEK